jgi:hypothetical protein
MSDMERSYVHLGEHFQFPAPLNDGQSRMEGSTIRAMPKAHSLTVGDLVARVEAPSELHRVTVKLPRGYVRVLPYRQEHFLAAVRHGGRTIWAGDGSQWIWVGRSS